MQTPNPTGWKAHVAAALGPRFKPWFHFANIQESAREVAIGVGGPWERSWFNEHILGMVRKAVRTQYPSANVVVFIDPAVRQHRVDYLASRGRKGGDSWWESERA